MTDTLISRRLDASTVNQVCALWRTSLPGTEDLTRLPEALTRLLRHEAVLGRGLFGDGSDGECFAFGLSAFLTDDACNAFIADPQPYLCLRILSQARTGDFSSLPTVEGLAKANSGDGLNLFILEYTQASFDFDKPLAHRLLGQIVPQYLANHAGYNIKRSLHETEVAKGHIQEAGGNRRLFDIAPQHPWSMAPGGLGPRAVYGLTREDAKTLPATRPHPRYRAGRKSAAAPSP